MTASATPWPEAPHTGLTRLADILTTANPRRHDALWELLHQVNPAAARTLARPDGAFRAVAQPRPDLDARNLERLRLGTAWHVRELLESVHRALVNAPLTLTAIAAGAANPVHPRERRGLSAPVARRLLVLGCEPHDVAVRRLTDATIDAVAGALAAPLD